MYTYGKPKLEKVNIGQSVFDLALVVAETKILFDGGSLFPWPGIVDNLFLGLFLVLLLWKLAMQRYTKVEIILFPILVLVSFYSSNMKHYYYLVYSVLMLIALKDVDIVKTVKRIAYTKTVILAIHVIWFFLCFYGHLGPVNVYVRNGHIRYDFFIGHPNTFALYLIWNTFEYLYIFYDKIGPWTTIFLWLVNMFFYQYTNSNTSLIVSSAVYLLVLIDKISRINLEAIYRFLAKYLFIIFSVFFWAICAFYLKFSGWMMVAYEWLDKALTGRLRYGVYAYDVYGTSLLGQETYFARKTYWHGLWIEQVMFDNSYIDILIEYGVIYLILISLGFFLTANKVSKKEAMLMIAYCGYAVMENYVLNAVLCFPLLFVGVYLFGQKQEEKQEEELVLDGKRNYSSLQHRKLHSKLS